MVGRWAGVALVVGLVGCSQPQEPLRVFDVTYRTSAAGRVEVTFSVENPSDQSRSVSCTVRAEDADGFRAGQDRLSGGQVPAGGSDVFTTVTGIDADGVARVRVEC